MCALLGKLSSLEPVDEHRGDGPKQCGVRAVHPTPISVLRSAVRINPRSVEDPVRGASGARPALELAAAWFAEPTAEPAAELAAVLPLEAQAFRE